MVMEDQDAVDELRQLECNASKADNICSKDVTCCVKSVHTMVNLSMMLLSVCCVLMCKWRRGHLGLTVNMRAIRRVHGL